MGQSQGPEDIFDAETRAVPENPPSPASATPQTPQTPQTPHEIVLPSAASGEWSYSLADDSPPEGATAVLMPNYGQRQRATSGATDSRPNRWPIIAISVIVLVALVAGGLYYLTGQRGRTTSQHIANTPQGVVNAYLLDYTGGKYEAMYQLVSAASIQRFDNPNILQGNYKNAEDYITTRTALILAAAQINSISASPGTYTQATATSGSIPVRVVLSSARVGDIIQDITIPVELEHGKWKVDWSPGLIFSQLDDPADPNYTRRVRLIEQNGLRGTIFDRDGNAIAQDETVYEVGVVPGQITNQTQVINTLSAKLGVSAQYVQSALQGAGADEFVNIRTITADHYKQIQSAISGVAGIVTQTTTGRVYPYGTMTAAVTGYVGQVSPDDLKNDKNHYYEAGDVIGRAGVELWGEQYLRPIKGGQLVIRERNADGSDGAIVYTIASRAPVNGADIHTTISLKAQIAAQTSLGQQAGHSGGSVAIDPATGEVLEMGSYPIYDPNDLSLGNPNEDQILSQMDHPFLNRAYADPQPIGSAFKPVTLAAGLHNGIDKGKLFTCNGTFQVPGESHIRNDDKPTGHGTLTMSGALAPSCDVIFWQVAVALNAKDPNLLPDMAKSFGYGSATNMIGLPAGAENPGLVPDPAWLKATQNAGWSPTDAANLAIGQGFFLATPVQVAMFSAAVANNGVRMQPRVVSSVMASGGATLVSFPATQAGTVALSADDMQTLQMALLGPTNDPSGTAYGAFASFPFLVAGKTGTAQSNQQKPNAWFTCYAPASPLSGPTVKPQIAVGSLVEFSDYGETYAMPVSRSVLAAYLNVNTGAQG